MNRNLLLVGKAGDDMTEGNKHSHKPVFHSHGWNGISPFGFLNLAQAVSSEDRLQHWNPRRRRRRSSGESSSSYNSAEQIHPLFAPFASQVYTNSNPGLAKRNLENTTTIPSGAGFSSHPSFESRVDYGIPTPNLSQMQVCTEPLSFKGQRLEVSSCEEKPFSYYIAVFLNLTDHRNEDILDKNAVLNDKKLFTFVHCVMEAIKKRKEFSQFSRKGYSDDYSPNIDAEEKKDGRGGSSKRKDQMLRLVFSAALKILMKRCSPSDLSDNCKELFDNFIKKYAASAQDRNNLGDFVRNSKFPSRKKLKGLFETFPLLGSDFSQILSEGVILNEYEKKRELKAAKIVEKFDGLYHIFPNTPEEIIKRLIQSFTSLPWSTQDISSACDILSLVVPKSGEGSKVAGSSAKPIPRPVLNVPISMPTSVELRTRPYNLSSSNSSSSDSDSSR